MTDAAAAVGEQRAAGPAAAGRETMVAGPEDMDERASPAPAARLAKRKVARVFGCCGTADSGLQVNPGVKTIEGDIFDAFCRAGAVTKETAVCPN